MKHLKVRSVYAADYKSSMGQPVSEASGRVVEKELNREINAALSSLPEQCGLVFRMSRFENLKYSEIADQLNISVKTVENHMGKALKLMRSHLKDYISLLISYFFIL
jgi:RNA polymerase sigma-70 factor (ECF subfamily)